MADITCDVAIIGAGTAGLSAHNAASDAGARAVIVESGPGGTTCARTGCMPSKLLIAAARAAHDTRNAALFGVHAGGVTVDGRAVMMRVRRERDQFVSGVMADFGKIPPDQRIAGRARFTAPDRLALDDGRTIAAKAIVIATGSATTIPPSLKPVECLTNESVFELDDLPASLAVVGAGPLGLELALAFRRLGVEVAIFDTGEALGGIKDPKVGETARAILARELDLVLGVAIEATAEGEGTRITWRGKAGSGARVFARVLVAAGRKPVLGDLALDRAGLALDEHGTPLFDPATMRCGESPIFIAGDADADRPVLHEAAQEGRIAGRNAAGYPALERQDRDTRLAVAFTDPEIATIGTGWPGEASEAAIGEADLSQSGRARAMGANAGLIRLYARRSDGLLLGAEMIGPEVEHLAHLACWLVQLGLTADAALALPFYHPTLEESLRTALRDVCAKNGFGRRAGAGLPGVT